MEKIEPGKRIEGDIKTGDECSLILRRHQGRGPPVLLVHGASAGSDTFRVGETQCLVSYLLSLGMDVWTLDWRASKNVAPKIYCDCAQSGRQKHPAGVFTIDAAADEDVPRALRHIESVVPGASVGIVAHCLGGGIVAQGIARGRIGPPLVKNVVLSTLGLFYRAAFDNVLKSADDPLDDLLYGKGMQFLHPDRVWDETFCRTGTPGKKGKWDPLLEVPYEVWWNTPLRHRCNNEFCWRLSYLFGMPYDPANIPTIHDSELPNQFGYIPVEFLLHCTRNLVRGHAGSLNARASDTTLLDPVPFRDLNVTLITGELNSLWHRESIDMMYEWLQRKPALGKGSRAKHVLRGFGHQDLQWGVTAPRDVFPLIAKGLARG